MIRVYLLAAFLGASLIGATPSGEEVFKQRCAGCHDANNPRIPRVEVLHRMPATSILRTLNWGVMGNVAYTMTIAEREAVASYLGTHDAPVAAPPTAFCADRAVHFANDSKETCNRNGMAGVHPPRMRATKMLTMPVSPSTACNG